MGGAHGEVSQIQEVRGIVVEKEEKKVSLRFV
jgi:hypothetical protein